MSEANNQRSRPVKLFGPGRAARLLPLLKAVLQRVALYHPLHDNYLRIFNHGYWLQHIKRRRTFYEQFVKAGDCVFDIGANVGEYTRCFVNLGAKVIAVEPQPNCVREIRWVHPQRHVTIVRAAVGAKPGFSTMHVSDTSVLSTLSDEWIASAEHSKRFSGIRWGGKITVPMITLDQLISTHGKPQFIKIDVEGFEAAVLDGLSYMPEAISFEFNPELIANTLECLNKPVLSCAWFNYYYEDSGEFRLRKWVSAREMSEIALRDLGGAATFGDIVALRDLPNPQRVQGPIS